MVELLYNKPYFLSSQAARAARDLLTTDDMGLQYSRSWLHDYVAEELNANYKLSVGWIGSQDRLAPQGVSYIYRRNNGGFAMPASIYYATVSSVDDLLDVLYDQFENNDDQNNKKNGKNNASKFSPEYILNALNIQNDEGEQLEGNIFIRNLPFDQFMAFDNNTINQLPRR